MNANMHYVVITYYKTESDSVGTLYTVSAKWLNIEGNKVY